MILQHSETAILLAAGTPSPSLRASYGRISSAMLPVNGRPVIQWSLKYLRESGYRRVIIGTNRSDERLRRFVSQVFSRSLELHFELVDTDRGPASTLLACLQNEACTPDATVILGDTLFRYPEARNSDAGNYVLTSDDAPHAHRWCYARVGEGARVADLIDKPTHRPAQCPVLIGVYNFDDVSPGRVALEQQAESDDLQMEDFLRPYIEEGNLRAFPAAEWSDCGNLDQLPGTRRRMIASRAFNSLEIDEVRGTITKRSTNQRKLVEEINYYRLLPPDLQSFFPRIVDFSILPTDIRLTLEYYGYPTLSELWAFEEFEPAAWKRIFERLSEVLQCFATYTIPTDPGALRRILWDKTLERLEAFGRQDEGTCELVNASTITLNGKPLQGWPMLLAWTGRRIENLTPLADARVIHGDLCFSNILYDPISQVLKLIDVRGSFGTALMYGDHRYDLAKLLHSVEGGYDFLIHDMFSVAREGIEITFEQFLPETNAEVVHAFGEVFGEMAPMREIRLIEALLFLSMCPLHSDRPDRQTAMFATGLKLLNQVWNDENLH